MYTTEAATELLIRGFNGTFTSSDRSWIIQTNHGHWIDFACMPDNLGGLSGGEQRVLRIAASIGSDEAPPVALGEVITGLDRRHLRLVVAAIAHNGGSHQHYEGIIEGRDGRAAVIKVPSLYPWDNPNNPDVGSARR